MPGAGSEVSRGGCDYLTWTCPFLDHLDGPVFPGTDQEADKPPLQDLKVPVEPINVHGGGRRGVSP